MGTSINSIGDANSQLRCKAEYKESLFSLLRPYNISKKHRTYSVMCNKYIELSRPEARNLKTK